MKRRCYHRSPENGGGRSTLNFSLKRPKEMITKESIAAVRGRFISVLLSLEKINNNDMASTGEVP